eukprot:GHRR01013962.1.p1 GENE.GHRR01013962.1~~GHRR01013962.1.p1  ORF type:complete len:150 (+),score=47.45 GHRR01013962.1:1036-1485(+)
MGTVGELKDAVKQTLEQKGLLPPLQAHLRSQIYQVVLQAEDEQRPEPSNENLIINELIREYLIFNGYRDTLSVFIPETGQPHTRPFGRDFLVKQLNAMETHNTKQLPLLYSLVIQRRQQQQPAPAPSAENKMLTTLPHQQDALNTPGTS